MANSLVMQSSNSFAELPEENAGLFLWEDPLGTLKFDILIQADS